MAPRDGQTEVLNLLYILKSKIDTMLGLNSDTDLEPRFVEQMLISRFHELSDYAGKAALLIAIDAVRKGHITKRNAADRLRIHPHTLDRAIRRYEEEYETAGVYPFDHEVVDRMK